MKSIWAKGCLIVVGLFTVGYIGAALVSGYAMENFLIPKFQNISANVRPHLPEILADLKLLEANPIFDDGPRKKDAQNLLSRHIGWESKGVKPDTSEYKALVALNAAYLGPRDVEYIKKLASDPRVEKLDVSWVDQVTSFDHWQPSSSEVVQAELKKVPELNGIGRIGQISTLALPDFQLFQFAVLVRFIQLQKNGAELKGLVLLRQSSDLMHSTHSLVGAMYASAGLSREHTVVEVFNIKNWPLVEKERIMAYRRLSWAWGGLIHMASWDTLPQEFLTFFKPRNGACAMGETLISETGFQDFLSSNAPFETDFSSRLEQSKDFMRKYFDVCSMKDYAGYLEPSQDQSNPVFTKGSNSIWAFVKSGNVTGNDDDSYGVNPVRIPFVRRILAMTIMTLAPPNFTKLYDERTPAATKPEPNPKSTH
ncbi:MAG TPA: hypothetical protein VN132_15400 [Bdellovibrio sp.]|nr:hypothetical protein [Bdellovibrio sp.]